MRLLLAFLFSVVMQSLVVCTQDDGSITFAQKSSDKIEETKKTTSILAKKQVNNFVEIQSFQVSERIYQHVFNHSTLAKNAITNKAISFIVPLNSIKQIRNKLDFSYRYILKCLYPKYSFW